MRILSVLSLFACASGAKIADTIDQDVVIVTDADGDGYTSAEDCNDNDSSVYQGAVEICDGIDNNCDGNIDEDVSNTFYADDDGDGFGDPNNPIEACSTPDNYVDTPNDCNDLSADAFPGNSEICDGIDNNCDEQIDENTGEEFFIDSDGDGFGEATQSVIACTEPDGYSVQEGDCDDTSGSTYPGAYEICDGIDNNCDDSIDNEAINPIVFYADIDEDGFGDPNNPIEACSLPENAVDNDEDCDDLDTAIHPAIDEVCDGIDNNCNGLTDEEGALNASIWYADADGDGFGTSSNISSCTQPIGFTDQSGDCDDTTDTVYPQATEVCDDLDNNCDGNIDEGLTQLWFLDYDGDGQGNTLFTQNSCTQPTAYVDNDGDCDDTNPLIYSDAEETCDELDNDCDGLIDNDAIDTLIFYEDLDLDGYGSTVGIESCELQTGYVDNDDDCDDTNPGMAPNQQESCDGFDNDCDGVEDNGVKGTGESCPAESCAAILLDNSTSNSGLYWLDWDGNIVERSCDMTTSGGGWTAVVYWDRENNGDDWTDLRNEMDEVFNNMTEQDTGNDYIIWSDYNITGDVMIFEKEVPFSNNGELSIDINYYGYSMENSAIYLYGETAQDIENVLCRDQELLYYSQTELDYMPYDCAISSNASWTWNNTYTENLTDDIQTLHFRNFQHDGGGGDRSYLYHLIMWVR